MSAENPGIGKPPTPPSVESESTKEEIPVYTEELLVAFDQLHESSITQEMGDDERAQVYRTLHGLAEHFENQVMFNAYEEGRVPTFASMERAVALVDEHLAQYPDDEDLSKLRKLLSQRVKEIRRWVDKYEQSIVVFHRKRKQMLFRSEEGVAAEFEKADMERRRIHNNLMEAIRSLDSVISEIHEQEPLPTKIYRWDPTQEVPKGFADDKPFIISASVAVHQNRDLIKDWALVANLEQKLDAQRAYLAQKNSEESE